MANLIVRTFEHIEFRCDRGAGRPRARRHRSEGIFNFAQGEFVLLGAYVTYIGTARPAGLARKWWRRVCGWCARFCARTFDRGGDSMLRQSSPCSALTRLDQS